MGDIHSQTRQIEIINSDELSYDANQADAKLLKGNVILRHNQATMWCDSALLFDKQNRFEAFGQIRIMQGDSITITGQKLVYDAITRKSRIDGNVYMQHGMMDLRAPYLIYFLDEKRAITDGNPLIHNGNTTLRGTKAEYFGSSRELIFRSRVEVTDPEYQLNTDSLNIDTKNRISYFYGSSRIITRQQDTIYGHRGEFNEVSNSIKIYKTVHLISGQRQLKSDSLFYNRIDNSGTATGNVEIVDYRELTVLYGDKAEVGKNKTMLRISGNPLSVQLTDSDYIYTFADTLLYIDDTLQEKNYMSAWRNVRIYKSDFQSVSDSAVYNLKDSSFNLYKNPVVWNKIHQFTADTILFFRKNGKAEKLVLNTHSFVLSHEVNNWFNQISGNSLTGYFGSDQLELVDVMGEGKSIYFIKEDSTHYTGMNYIMCEKMRIRISRGNVSDIRFYKNNSGKITPINDLNNENIKLEGFRSRYNERPEKPAIKLPF